jgi:hypothetical protein
MLERCAYHGGVRTCQAQHFEDTPEARRELAGFLQRVFAKGADACAWERRFEHWWDLNPFAELSPERGWVIKSLSDDTVVGFLGLIPACYSVDSVRTPAVVPTTWVVDPRYREAALMLGRRLQQLIGRTLIVSTTGRREFQGRLVKRGWVLNTDAFRQFVPCGWAARWMLGSGAPLAHGQRITGDVDEVRSILGSVPGASGIEKCLTPEYLRWYRNSPAREHRFAGVVDAEGRLSSFLMLAPSPLAGILNVWAVVDWFTAGSSNEELRGLLAAVAEKPEMVGICGSGRTRPFLLRLTAMADDETWKGVRGLWRAPVTLNHFHCPPEPLRLLPKRCVLAEGDLGL